MDRKGARLALELAERWTREGLMPAASLQVLRRRHAAEARDDPDAESFGAGILYALGGVLLGAAAIALLVLLEDNGLVGSLDEVAPWGLLVWGVLCLGAGLAIDLAARKPRLGDAFHVAALFAVTAASFPRAEDLPALGIVAMAFAVGMVLYRRTRFLVPALAVVAFNVALPNFLFEGLEGLLWGFQDGAVTLWFCWAAVQVPMLVLASRVAHWPWASTSLAAATLLLAATFLAFFFEVAEDALPSFRGDVEVYLAILMGVCLGAGLLLREKGLVLASAFAIAIDAIAFAFAVGEIIGGLLALLAVAGALIWQAGNLRRYLRE